MTTVNVVGPPFGLVASIVPPRRRAFSNAIASPSPNPPRSRERLRSALKNRSKRCGKASAGIPGPPSDTESRHEPFCSPIVTRRVTLEEANEAFFGLLAGAPEGKVLVTP